jgi:hypothetical protein
MYCPSCGTQTTPGLSYCSRCGNNLNPVLESTSSINGPVAALTTAITLVGLSGLGMILGGLLVLKKEAGLPNDILVGYMLLTFVLTALIDLLLIWQLARVISRRGDRHDAGREKRKKKQETRELYEATPRTLPEPAASVTEHTTRIFEPVYREPQK